LPPSRRTSTGTTSGRAEHATGRASRRWPHRSLRGRTSVLSPTARRAHRHVEARRTPRKHRTGLSRLIRYLEGRWLLVAALMLAAVGEAAAQTGGWILVREAINRGVSKGDERFLIAIVGIYLAVQALGWVLMAFLIRGLARIGQGVVLGLRRDLFDHLTSLSLRYFSEQRAGWIIARLTSDVDAISDVASQGLPTLVTNVVLLPAAVVALFVNDWRLGLVALVVLPPALVLTRWFQVRSAAAQLEVRNRIAAVTAQIAESLAGMAVVQAFNRERTFQSEFDRLNGANRDANVYAQKIFSVFFPSIEFLGVLASAGVILVGAHLIDSGSMQIGTLLAAIYLLQLVFQPLQELSDVYGMLQSGAAAMVKISAVLDAQPEITDRPGAKKLQRIDGALELDDVRFAYGDEDVLHGVDLRVPPGGCVALVGVSGGGKSTLAKLVARFYDPDSGAVRVDGQDLRDVQLRSYRRQLGVVLQDPFLFSGTIADNIRFARPDATDEQVRETAAAIGVDRVAARLKDGLEHTVREGGSGLSAGERQLISIARALLADPRILILDEATSNIDRPTEILIERALDRLLRGRTSIIIAHRLTTVRRADEILVVDRGRVVQRGAPRELLTLDGPFQRLARDLRRAAGAPVNRSAQGSLASARRE
jgi:ATP-binding cassette subfamily B protein